MKVTFLGTGTSQGVPVIACDCHVCRSKDPKDKRLRSSLHIEYDGYSVVVDTGPDFRYQMLREHITRLDAVLITHAHKDHTAGMDDVRAFNYKQQRSIPIYGLKETHHSLRNEFYYAFTGNGYPGVPRLELEEIQPGKPFVLGAKTIMPIGVLHHKMPVLGFRISDFAYITDAKTIPEESYRLLDGVEVLVLNALQKAPHISHLTLDEALDVAERVGAEATYLTHIGHRFGTHQEITSWLPDKVHAAFDRLQLTVV